MPPLRFLRRGFCAAVVFWAVLFSGMNARALTFVFNNTGGMPQQVVDGFTAAGQLWSSVLSDNVTLSIDIGYANLGPGVIGQTSMPQYFVPYADYRAALVSDKTSAFDNSALASLPNATGYPVSYNYVTDGTTPASSTTAVGSSSRLIINQATLRALGDTETFADPDASITFSSGFNFDFNRTDGITAGQYDFVGAAAHELGHVLGFSSIVDYIDANAFGTPANGADIDPTALDLFRYSAAGVRDISAGTAAYFSYDSGATSLGDMSTGVNTGDGRQASHWKDNEGLGIMDPTLAPGETEVITLNDLKALDVIGWDVTQFSAVPEPADTALLVAGGMLGLVLMGRGSRKV